MSMNTIVTISLHRSFQVLQRRRDVRTYLESFGPRLTTQPINRARRRIQLEYGMIHRQRKLLQRFFPILHPRPFINFPRPLSTLHLLQHRPLRLFNLRRPLLIRVPIRHHSDRPKLGV
jgi:hypothetical protein